MRAIVLFLSNINGNFDIDVVRVDCEPPRQRVGWTADRTVTLATTKNRVAASHFVGSLDVIIERDGLAIHRDNLLGLATAAHAVLHPIVQSMVIVAGTDDDFFRSDFKPDERHVAAILHELVDVYTS